MHFFLPDIYMTAINAAIDASDAIMEIYRGNIERTIKKDGSPVTQADIKASEIIATCLKQTGIPILGEELKKDPFSVRRQWSENWCVDPLDGTKMFLKRNGEFSVNIAHIVQGKATFGIIANPVHRTVLVGGQDYGAYIIPFEEIENVNQWEKLHPKSKKNNPIKIICSWSYKEILKNETMASLVQGGAHVHIRKGSALKFFDLCNGTVDLYPRFAPTMEWDIAAGQAILETLGGAVLDLTTKAPLSYNKEDLFNPHFIAMTKPFIRES